MQGTIFFWVFVLFLLALSEMNFCNALLLVYRSYMKLKKEYALSTNDGYNGHSGRLIYDVEKDLNNKRTQLVCWICISIAGAYAIIDCFLTHIIK